MYIKREISEMLIKFADFFPVVAVMGPRQSGKTTLVQREFAEYYYLNLENLGVRELAAADLSGFLEKLLDKKSLIIY